MTIPLQFNYAAGPIEPKRKLLTNTSITNLLAPADKEGRTAVAAWMSVANINGSNPAVVTVYHYDGTTNNVHWVESVPANSTVEIPLGFVVNNPNQLRASASVANYLWTNVFLYRDNPIKQTANASSDQALTSLAQAINSMQRPGRGQAR